MYIFNIFKLFQVQKKIVEELFTIESFNEIF